MVEQLVTVIAQTDEDLQIVCVGRAGDVDGVDPPDASGLADRWVVCAEQLLQAQWRRGGEGYRPQLVQKVSASRALPCNYLLVLEGEVVGHARLAEVFDSGDGCAAAATFVLIAAERRGRRLGARLMAMVEDEARSLGYHYLYLWTKDAVGFYERIGYMHCSKVSVRRPVLELLQGSQISALEAMLAKRAPPNPDAAAPGDVWLRKRLAECVAPERLDEAELAAAIAAKGAVPASVRSVPWQRQIGPSCGLAALRAVRDELLEDAGRGAEPQPSLLAAAQARGATVDGEIFDINELLALATETCGLRATCRPLGELSAADVASAVAEGRRLVLPYDADAACQPCCHGGLGAHYGIIVGVCEAAGREVDAADVADCNAMLVVQHGRSRVPAVASLALFRRSNAQLDAADVTRYRHVPRLDLKGKVLVVDGLEPQE